MMWEAAIFTLLTIFGTFVFFTFRAGGGGATPAVESAPKVAKAGEKVVKKKKPAAVTAGFSPETRALEELAATQLSPSKSPTKQIRGERQARGASTQLPAGWTMAWSNTHQQTYYWHGATETTSWTLPGGHVVADNSDTFAQKDSSREYRWSPSSEPLGEASPRGGGQSLPPGWTKHKSETFNKDFYWHEDTQTTQWEKPKGMDDRSNSEERFPSKSSDDNAPESKVFEFNKMMDSHGKTGDAVGAVELLSEMRKASCKPNVVTYNILIAIHAKKYGADTSKSWFDKMVNEEGLKPDVVSYSTMIDAYAKASRPKEAATWLQKMQEANVKPNVVSYTTVITAYANAGMAQEAAQWLATMRHERVPPSVISCNAVIAAYVQASQPDVAASWLEKMRGMGVQPNVVSYSTVIDGYAKKLRPEEAASWLFQMQDANVMPNVVTYSTVVNAYAKAHDPDEAASWLDRMRNAGVQPNIVSYNTIMNGFAKIGNLALVGNGPSQTPVMN